MNGFIKLFCFSLLLSFLVSCVPTEIGTVAQCGPNEAYDAVKRICYDTTVPHQPPTPTLKRIDLIEDQAAQEFVLTYTDVDGDLATNCSIISRADGIDDVPYSCQCQGGVCTVKVQPDPDFSGYTELVYSLTDINGVSAGKSVAVYVSVTNDPPVASNVSVAVVEDIAKSFTLTATDQDGDSVYFVKLSDPAKGSVSFNGASGSVTYTPALNDYGTQSFMYKVCDYGSPSLCSGSYTVTLNISAVDDAPVALDVTGTVAEGGSAAIALSYTDAENDAATSCDTVPAAAYPCSCTSGVCSLSFSSLGDFNGVISISYTVTANGKTSDPATAAVTVTPVNDAPVISLTNTNPVPAGVNEGVVTTFTGDQLGIILGEGGTGTYEASQSTSLNITWTTLNPIPANAQVVSKVEVYYDSVLKGEFTTNTSSTYLDLGDGTLAVDGSKLKIVVTPKSNESGVLSFTLKLRDSETPALTTTSVNKIGLTILDTNDAPVISTIDSIEMNEGDEPYTHAFTIEEGPGDTEDNQAVSFSLTSSNPALLPVENITVTYRHNSQTARTIIVPSGVDYVIPTSFTPPATTDYDSGNYNLYLKIDPVDGVSGTATITVTADDGMAVNSTAEQSFTVTVNPIGANHGGWTKINARGSRTDRFDNTVTAYDKPMVELAWNNFTTATSASNSNHVISGWRVYRRELDIEYDWDAPITGLVDIDANTLTYQDTTVSENKIYFYTVRPVDSSTLKLSIPTKEIFSEVRVYVPPKNQVFVHRWMMNQEVCKMMLMTEDSDDPAKRVDPTNNFRCPYYGPGEASGYYDIGKDLVVDAVEVGCPYTQAPVCGINGCIGSSAPAVAASGAIFYNRSNGVCYLSDGAAWNEMDAVALFASSYVDVSNRSFLPPLTNISQQKAYEFCSAKSSLDLGSGAISFALPSRKEQIAFSSWDDFTDVQINEYELGQYINAGSKCNSSAASGLSTYYSDIAVPNTSYLYTLPGTKTSQIRSLYTGSQAVGSIPLTNSCQSRYGLQDVYGNVAEWTSDRFICYPPTHPKAYTCAALNAVNVGPIFPAVWLLTDDYYDIDDNFFDDYRLDGIRGPCQDNLENDGVCDSPMTSWAIEKTNNLSGNFIFPLGLPARTDYAINFPYSDVSDSLLPIGSTQGIEIEKLHNDTFVFNTYPIYQTSGYSDLFGDIGLASMATGGSYLTTSDAGRYSMELTPMESVGATKASQSYGSNYVLSVLQENEIHYDYVTLGTQIQLTAHTPTNGNHFTFSIVNLGATGAVSIDETGAPNIVINTYTDRTVDQVLTALNAAPLTSAYFSANLLGSTAGADLIAAVGATTSSTGLRVKTYYPWWGANISLKLENGANSFSQSGYNATTAPTTAAITVRGSTFSDIATLINSQSITAYSLIAEAVVPGAMVVDSATISMAPYFSYRLKQQYAHLPICIDLALGGAAGVSYDGLVANGLGSMSCYLYTITVTAATKYSGLAAILDGDVASVGIDADIPTDTSLTATTVLKDLIDYNYVGSSGDSYIGDTDYKTEYRFINHTMLLSSQLSLTDGPIDIDFSYGSSESISFNTTTRTATITIPDTKNTFSLANTLNSSTALNGIMTAKFLFLSDAIVSAGYGTPVPTLTDFSGSTSSGDLLIESKGTGELWNSQKISFIDSVTAGNEYAEYSSDHIIVNIEAGVTSAQDVYNALIANASINSLVDITVNNPDALQGAFSNIYLENGINATPNRRSDIGFRCQASIIPALFPTDSYHTYSY